MTFRAAQLGDEGKDAAEASNMAKYAAGGAVIQALDQAIQIHGGNASPTSTACPTCGSSPGCSAPPPVSREMVFNHIAQHSLGLPKSY